MEERFFADDILKVTGVKRQRLEVWVKEGFVKPSIQVAAGHGSRNIWNRNDLYLIATFKKVTESGLPRQMVAKFLAKLKENIKEGKIATKAFDQLESVLFVVRTPYSINIKQNRNRMLINLYFKGKEEGYSLDEFFTEPFQSAFDYIFLINFGKVKYEVDVRIEGFCK